MLLFTVSRPYSTATHHYPRCSLSLSLFVDDNEQGSFKNWCPMLSSHLYTRHTGKGCTVVQWPSGGQDAQQCGQDIVRVTTATTDDWQKLWAKPVSQCMNGSKSWKHLVIKVQLWMSSSFHVASFHSTGHQSKAVWQWIGAIAVEASHPVCECFHRTCTFTDTRILPNMAPHGRRTVCQLCKMNRKNSGSFWNSIPL